MIFFLKVVRILIMNFVKTEFRPIILIVSKNTYSIQVLTSTLRTYVANGSVVETTIIKRAFDAIYR